MKTWFLSLVALLLATTNANQLYAQLSAAEVRSYSQRIKVHSIPHHTVTLPQERSATYAFALDYDDLDRTNAQASGYNYYYNPWNLNAYLPNDSNFTFRTAAVLFDSLFYLNTADQNFYYHPRATSVVTIDSIQIPFLHERTAAGIDSIIVTIFDVAGGYTLTGSDSNAQLNTVALWDTVIATTTVIAVNNNGPLNYTLYTFYPNLQLSKGQLFGVKVDFKGTLGNHIQFLSGYRDVCFDGCVAVPSLAGQHSIAYWNYVSTSTQNLSGFAKPYFDCDQNGGYTPAGCEDFYIQNNVITPFLTIQADTIIEVNPVYLPAGYNLVRGVLFRDVNQNGVYDGGDGVIANKTVTFNQTGLVSTVGSGTISRLLPTGVYNVTVPVIPNYTLTTLPANFALNLSGQIDTFFAFGYVSTAASDSVSAVTAVTQNVCSTVASVWATVYNDGTNSQDLRLTLYVDTPVTFLSAPGSTSVQAQQAKWNIAGLAPLSQHSVNALLQMPSFLSMGDTVEYLLQVEKFVNNTWVNVYDYLIKEIIVCSYDPNDKRVFPQGETYNQYTLMNTPLHYTIRFQNTGNFPAAKVEVHDTLDTDLNYSTFKLLAASHAVVAEVENGRYISFVFDNINLPDSASNEPGSHGYVSYSVQPKAGLPVSTVVDNTAHIYFDFNPAVVTNTTTTQYVTQFPTGITKVFDDGLLSVYPNPFTDELTMKWEGNASASIIKLFGVEGQLIYSKTVTGNQHRLSLNQLPKGLYFVQINNGNLRTVKVAKK